MATYTALQVIDLARFLIDRDGTEDGGTNAQLLPVLSSKYFTLRARLVEVAPDLYTALQTFTIAAGSTTWTITPTDFAKPLKVERLESGTYYPMNVAPRLTAESTPGWRLRGTVIEVFPTADAPGNFRLTYAQKPSAAITTTSDNLTLPEGMQLVLAYELAAIMMARLDEDPRLERQAAIDEWNLLVPTLVDQYGATPQQVAQIY